MSKVWQPSDAKKFARQVEFGKTYYFVYNVANNLAPYEDQHLYSEAVFTRRAPLTGNPMTDGGTSAEGLCLRYGPIYDAPPQGIRNVAAPAPQVAGPLPAGYKGVLDEAELRGLEKQVAQSSDPKKRRWGR